MTLTRLTAWALLAATAFSLTQNGPVSQASPTREPATRTDNLFRAPSEFEAGTFDLEPFQGFPILQEKEPPFPAKNATAFGKVKDAQEGPRIDKADLDQLRAHMKTFAEYYANIVSHPLVYKIIQDPSKLPKFEDPNTFNIDKKIEELGKYLHEPHPSNRTGFGGGLRVTPDKADYIRELGTALEVALMKVVNEHPERIVKVNAMRMYASVCKTGAAVHWPTVTALLKNENTPTQIKFYALQAAANLLWAYDPNDYTSRRHSIGSKPPRAEADKEIGALVKAIEDCVTNPKLLVPDFPQGKDAKVSPEQIEVVRYVRRQAIRALAEVRFVTLPGPEGKDAEGKVKWIYPAHTLARVCMSDPTLFPSPTPSECGEAVIGLCNMAPIWERAPVKNFNADLAAEAVATGIITFATPRSASAADRSIPWVRYSVRMSEALKGWRPLFNFLYDPVKPNDADGDAAPRVVTDLVNRAQKSVLTPMSKVPPDQVSVGDVAEFLKSRKDDPKRTGVLFTDVPQTALPVVQQK
jgi:hypothetical protein